MSGSPSALGQRTATRAGVRYRAQVRAAAARWCDAPTVVHTEAECVITESCGECEPCVAVELVLTDSPARSHEHALGWHYDDLSGFVLRLVVYGEPFVMKNSKQIVALPKRRPILVPSKAAKRFLRSATEQLRTQWGAVFTAPLPASVLVQARIVSYLGTRRRTDLSNCYGAVEDAMQAGGVLEDDWQIASHDGSRRLYDKQNPRTEIIITPYRR
jgi:Holliday junction resolvase RusA-like endonuclease